MRQISLIAKLDRIRRKEFNWISKGVSQLELSVRVVFENLFISQTALKYGMRSVNRKVRFEFESVLEARSFGRLRETEYVVRR